MVILAVILLFVSTSSSLYSAMTRRQSPSGVVPPCSEIGHEEFEANGVFIAMTIVFEAFLVMHLDSIDALVTAQLMNLLSYGRFVGSRATF